MEYKQLISKEEEPKIYKTVEDALDAKHNLAKKTIAKIGIAKITALSKKTQPA